VISGTVRGGVKTALPMPYGFAPEKESLKVVGKGDMKIVADGEGGYFVEAESHNLLSFSIDIGRGGKIAELNPDEKNKILTGDFLAETEAALEDIKKSGRTKLEQARMLKQYVRKKLKYSNDSSLNKIHRRGDPSLYFQRIEENEKADCDVANTYYIALLSKLGITGRLVTGHYVKTKNHAQAAVMSAGTGHAWTEVWDRSSWHRLDATPPGDPDMDEEETDEIEDDEFFEGDFGEQDAEEISDEELKKMIEQAEKDLKAKAKDPIEKKAASFAEQAGCLPEEAKKIISQIEAARELRDKQGRKIRGRIVAEFQRIVKRNLVKRLRYKAPVRLSDSSDLADPVEAVLDIKAQVADPTGFSKHEIKSEIEQVYGGFDVFFLVDKSTSMKDIDPVSGQPKWQEQQKMIFLLMDALNFSAMEFKRNKIKLISPIDLRFSLIGFASGGAKIDLKLGGKWTPKEQYEVWKSLQSNIGGGTPDHLGLLAAGEMIESDKKENPREKERLRLVIVSADGGSDDKSKTISAKESLKELGAVVKAAGIGAGAKEIEAAYYPDGKNLPGFGDLPDWVGSVVLAEAQKLHPKKISKTDRQNN